MARRYVTYPQGWEGEWTNEPGPQQPTLTVWERDRIPQRSGLLDPNGNELYVIEDMEPIGFVPVKL